MNIINIIDAPPVSHIPLLVIIYVYDSGPGWCVVEAHSPPELNVVHSIHNWMPSP